MVCKITHSTNNTTFSGKEEPETAGLRKQAIKIMNLKNKQEEKFRKQESKKPEITGLTEQAAKAMASEEESGVLELTRQFISYANMTVAPTKQKKKSRKEICKEIKALSMGILAINEDLDSMIEDLNLEFAYETHPELATESLNLYGLLLDMLLQQIKTRCQLLENHFPS